MGISDLLSDIWSQSEAGGSDDPSAAGHLQSAETVVYECRNCGTTVSADTGQCPSCESSEIAVYPIE